MTTKQKPCSGCGGTNRSLARLIAAAPELLGALEEAKILLVYGQDGWDGVGDSSPQQQKERVEAAIESAVVAIQAATGEEE